jgi:hypothetical protein
MQLRKFWGWCTVRTGLAVKWPHSPPLAHRSAKCTRPSAWLRPDEWNARHKLRRDVNHASISSGERLIIQVGAVTITLCRWAVDSEKWVTRAVNPNLPPDSVVLPHNALSYHNHVHDCSTTSKRDAVAKTRHVFLTSISFLTRQ